MYTRYKIKHYIKDFFKSKFVLNLLGDIAYMYASFVGRTSKYDVQGIKEFEKLIEKNNGGIFIAWHGRALMLPYFWENPRPMKALVSPHTDGRIIARLLQRFNIQSIDGSSNHNAKKSAFAIIKELNQGTAVALIPDGPRGPSMHLNKSVLYFAQKTGKPIMGFTYSSHKANICKKSWDDMIIPKPLKQGYIRATSPLFVPSDISDEDLETLRQKLEKELIDLTLELDKTCGLPPIIPGQTPKQKR